jgi:hypothetical protein
VIYAVMPHPRLTPPYTFCSVGSGISSLPPLLLLLLLLLLLVLLLLRHMIPECLL